MRTCSTCGHANPDDARFCASCGTTLDVAGGVEARKIVTVLFADVAGSTALGERLDPESVRHVMSEFFDVARRCVERRGGAVEKFIGDAVMAVFGVPTVHEDDALRAVLAASDLRTSLGALNEKLAATHGVTLHVRVGVNTGEVVVGTDERLATGDAVNVAARLEQAAGPDEILIGDETLELARDAVEVEQIAPLELKGKAAPVPAHRLLRAIEGAPAYARRLDAPLIGRGEEVARIRASFQNAVDERRCHLVTLVGAPGIGKSRTTREATAKLATDATVLSGRCLPYGEGITFWPLREIFAAAGAEAELDAALESGAAEEIFWAVRKSIERRARERPLVLVVEDIQWAEATLLDLLEHVVDWTRDAPVLLICPGRPELLDDRPAWSGRPNAETIRLEPLGDRETDQLLDALFAESQRDDVRVRIREVADGNPLFVEQLAATFKEGGDVDRVPSTVQALLAARLDALAEPERRVLEHASVVGAEFGWDALPSLDEDRRRPSGALLSGLVRKDLLAPLESVADTFRFRHMLIRDAAYAGISKARRADLHERVATWLRHRGDEYDEIVAHHLEQAHRYLIELGPPTPRARALADDAAMLLSDAGRRANGRGDTPAAVSLLERATSLLDPADPRRLGVLPTLGRALREAGRTDRAEIVLVEAMDLGGSVGQRAVAADASVALSDLRFHRAASTGVAQKDVLRTIEAAVEVFQAETDPIGLGRALVLAGKLRFWAGEAAAAAVDLRRAADLLRDAGGRTEEADALQYVVAAMHRGPMPIDEALVELEALRARGPMNPRLETAVLLSGGHLEGMRGRLDAARTSIAQARLMTTELGMQVPLHSHARPAAGYIELLAGDAVTAEGELRAACEGLERLGEFGYLSSIAPMLVDALLEQGRDDDAWEATERWNVDRLTVPEDADAQASWRRVRARVLARRGSCAEAQRLAREAVEIISATDFLDARATTVADLAEVLALCGKRDEGARATAEAIELHEAKGSTALADLLRQRQAALGG